MPGFKGAPADSSRPPSEAARAFLLRCSARSFCFASFSNRLWNSKVSSSFLSSASSSIFLRKSSSFSTPQPSETTISVSIRSSSSWTDVTENCSSTSSCSLELPAFESLLLLKSLFLFLSFTFSCMFFRLSFPFPELFLESRASSAKKASLAASDFSVASFSARSSKCARRNDFTSGNNIK
uniref:Uncharacterized protein n=1 Tax=Opuntia streptacantha TaxID=393608 RepID=A0A7C9AFM7_OPUST